MDGNTHLVCYDDADGKTKFYEIQGFIQYMGEALAIEKAKQLANDKPGRQVFVLRAVVRVGPPATAVEVARLEVE